MTTLWEFKAGIVYQLQTYYFHYIEPFNLNEKTLFVD